MSQKSDNAAYMQEVSSSLGRLTLLIPPKQGIVGLREPYEFKVTNESVVKLVQALKATMLEIAPFMQYATVSTTKLKHGIKLSVFVLGYNVGFTGNPTTGVTSAQWHKVTRIIRDIIRAHLGKRVKVYIEPWTPERKFHLRFEAYIMKE